MLQIEIVKFLIFKSVSDLDIKFGFHIHRHCYNNLTGNIKTSYSFGIFQQVCTGSKLILAASVGDILQFMEHYLWKLDVIVDSSKLLDEIVGYFCCW